MKRILPLVWLFALILSLSLSAGCTPTDGSGEFAVYEGKVVEESLPAGGSSVQLELQNGWKLYTVDSTLCFDASDGKHTLASGKLYRPGDRIKVWAGQPDSLGRRPCYCILVNPDQAQYSGAFFTVGSVDSAGDSLVFSDAGTAVSVTVDRNRISGRSDQPVAGATCFVFYRDAQGKRPVKIVAERVTVVTVP